MHNSLASEADRAWRELCQTVDALFGPTGCAWCEEQTHETLVPYLIEECAELVDAIEFGNRDDLVEELGDVAFQVLFHAKLGQRSGTFTLDEVLDRLREKIVRRNPHVFGAQPTREMAEILRLWHEAKAAEKQHRTSVLDGIAFGMPALALADKVIGKGELVGVPAPRGETIESDDVAEAYGEALLASVAAAREAGIDPERALRDAVRRHAAVIREHEAQSEQAAERDA